MTEQLTQYVGTKFLQARPMNRGDYNQYRGWEIPADEDPAEAGYLVVYPDGYESWSPAPQFEAAYLSLGDYALEGQPEHVVRMCGELEQLGDRQQKLEDFLADREDDLPTATRLLMRAQLHAMATYMYTLTNRLGPYFYPEAFDKEAA